MKKGEAEAAKIEKQALIREIEKRIRTLDVEKLRRIDWYIDKIDK